MSQPCAFSTIYNVLKYAAYKNIHQCAFNFEMSLENHPPHATFEKQQQDKV